MNPVAQMTRQERIAWLALVVMSPAVLYLAWALFLDPVGRGGDVAPAARLVANYASVVFLGAYWLWIRRRSAGLPVDERDRQIGARAVRGGFLTLGTMVVAAAGVSSLEAAPVLAFTHSRSVAWVATYLMLCVYTSLAVVSAVRAAHYRHDRA